MAHFFLMAMSKSRSRRSPGDVEKSISEMTGGNVDPAGPGGSELFLWIGAGSEISHLTYI